ncbi:hypothetical protein DFH07DRAFT_973778 [Mycena maculata]|uniref:Uncharacterized protein n=1 Tax=Mycena maculata TaxID=230809 RepID=A0AAD7HBF8_9AGAR|nr:hypothetical protein DFH07DRAFT_973778 [Mycena maculata]
MLINEPPLPLYSDGLPQKLLPQAAVCATLPPLREQLLREGHLTPKSLVEWHKRLQERTRMTPALVLFALHQLFPVHFAEQLCLTVVTKERVHSIRMPDIFVDEFLMPRQYRFEGSALARFELSLTMPNMAHLRIVKILEPVSVSAQDTILHGLSHRDPRRPPTRIMIRPQEGALISFCMLRRAPGIVEEETNEDVSRGDGEPWTFDLRWGTLFAEALRVALNG